MSENKERRFKIEQDSTDELFQTSGNETLINTEDFDDDIFLLIASSKGSFNPTGKLPQANDYN